MFFLILPSKQHYAISDKTAVELVFEKASSNVDNLDLTNWLV